MTQITLGEAEGRSRADLFPSDPSQLEPKRVEINAASVMEPTFSGEEIKR